MRTLNALAALAFVASCGSTPRNPNLVAADREDQARSLCTSTARAYDLRVSSTYAPIRIDAQRFEVGMRTRDAAGMAERRCIANVATNRARII